MGLPLCAPPVSATATSPRSWAGLSCLWAYITLGLMFVHLCVLYACLLSQLKSLDPTKVRVLWLLPYWILDWSLLCSKQGWWQMSCVGGEEQHHVHMVWSGAGALLSRGCSESLIGVSSRASPFPSTLYLKVLHEILFGERHPYSKENDPTLESF